jgi:hypothetical protein
LEYFRAHIDTHKAPYRVTTPTKIGADVVRESRAQCIRCTLNLTTEEQISSSGHRFAKTPRRLDMNRTPPALANAYERALHNCCETVMLRCAEVFMSDA